MDEDMIRDYFSRVKKAIESYDEYITKRCMVTPTYDMKAALVEGNQIIRQMYDEMIKLEAKIEAERAVKERFKELYVESFVDKALKEEISEKQEDRISEEKTVFFKFHGTNDDKVYSFANLKEMLLALERRATGSEPNKEKYKISDLYVKYYGFDRKLGRENFMVCSRRFYEEYFDCPQCIGYCSFINI